MKIFCRMHNCLELWQHFALELKDAQDDKQLAMFTSYIFKDHSLEYKEFVANSVLPQLLLIADRDEFVIERLESLQAGLQLLKLH